MSGHFFATSKRDRISLGIIVEADARATNWGGDCAAIVERLQPTPDQNSITGKIIDPKLVIGDRFLVN